MNRAVLIGNLVRDPELRETDSGIPVCTFALAVNRRYANQQGEREADYIPIVAWRGLAALCSLHLSKGRKCAVTGAIQTRSYTAQDGGKRYATEVVAEEVEFLGAPQGGSKPPLPEPPPPPPKPEQTRLDTVGAGTMLGDDELPF